MTRTTPARPADVLRLFPELALLQASATRLHPRPGRPTAADSSIGGPLLWPAGEPWPVCEDGDAHDGDQPLAPATVRRVRELRAAAAARGGGASDEETAELLDLDFAPDWDLVEQPLPMIPVLQLYRRDVADFPGPDDTDLLQVLWCPLDHPAEDYCPPVEVFWRSAADVTDPLGEAPEPPLLGENYLPVPCVVDPEQIREYPHAGLLPEGLRAAVRAWESEHDGVSYQNDLSIAPGWKAGGFVGWGVTDPYPVLCPECGSAMVLMVTAAFAEWDSTDSWRPVEEPAGRSNAPTEVVIGRGNTLCVLHCPVDFGHPLRTLMA